MPYDGIICKALLHHDQTMTEPTLNYVSCRGASQRMAYWLWSSPAASADSPVVMCVHGLTRQGRDFDVLARALLAATDQPLRVVCPDVLGRGHSDWLDDAAGYQIPAYAADMLDLLRALQPTRLDWVGTSMGGLIGMVACVQPAEVMPVPVRRLVLNDVGPSVEWGAIERIGQYLGQTGRFDTVEQAADAMWAVSQSFGPHTREQWLALSRPMVRTLPEGGFTLHYDPALALPFRSLTREAAAQGDALLWQLYDQIRADTLVLRGADSDLLRRETALAMHERGPRARVVELPGVGHAPTLIATDQVRTVLDFLLRP